MRFGLVIGQVAKIGGMEKQAMLLTEEFKKRDLDATLFTAGVRKRAAARGLNSIAHKYLYYSRYTGWASRQVLRNYCRTRGITHLMGYNVANTELAVTAHVMGGTALNVREIGFAADSELAQRYRSVARQCDWVVTNSENTAGLLEEYGIAKEADIAVIHNGIELPARASKPDEKIILWVASLKQLKDPMTFVEACRDVIRGDGEVKVVMVGAGPMRTDIEEYMRANGLRKHFVLMGEVRFEEIPYAKASVFVNTSTEESSSNSVAEALSFGIPVVATDNPGNRHILSGLDHHQIVPVADPVSLREAIRIQLDIGGALRERISEESRKYIDDNYSVSKMVDRYIRMFSNK